MIKLQLEAHIAKFESTGKPLSKLERKLILDYYSDPKRTVASIIKSYSKKLGKGDLRVKQLLKGLYQDSPVNRAVFNCIDRYVSAKGLQKYEASAELKEACGTVVCPRLGRTVPNVTPNDYRELIRRMDNLAKARGLRGLLVPNGATHDNLEKFATYTFNTVNAVRQFTNSHTEQLAQDLGLNLSTQQKSLLDMTVAHLNSGLVGYARQSSSTLRRDYDKAIEVVQWRAMNATSGPETKQAGPTDSKVPSQSILTGSI